MNNNNYFFDTRVQPNPRQKLAEILASPNVSGASGPSVVSSGGAVRPMSGGATLGEGFGAAIANFMNLRNDSLDRRKEDELRQQTLDARTAWLVEQGVSPERAAAFAADGNTFAAVVQELEGKEAKTWEVDGKIVRDNGQGGVEVIYEGGAKPDTKEVGGRLYERQADGSYQMVIDKPSDFEEMRTAYDKAIEAGQFEGTIEEFSKLVGKGGTTVNVGEKLTEGQSKDIDYFNKGTYSNNKLTPEMEKALTEPGSKFVEGVPGIGNAAVSKEYQRAKVFGRSFLAAILRKESGGAITDEEWAEYGPIYLPQPFDDEQTINEKRWLRENALDGLKLGLGTAELLGEEIELKNAPSSQQPAETDSGETVIDGVKIRVKK